MPETTLADKLGFKLLYSYEVTGKSIAPTDVKRTKPYYKCQDCGMFMSSSSPVDDDCWQCHGINVKYLGTW